MRTKYIIIICICLTRTGSIFAQQWTAKDSLWLQDVLSGKEKIKLKPEVLNAIEKGTLLNTDIMQPKDQFKEAPAEIPLLKDFSDYIQPADKDRPVDPLSMPPAVFMRYGLNVPLPTIYKSFLIPDEIKKNGVKPSGRSFNDGLMQLFSPKERRKMRARQNANAWKNYNRFP